MQTTNTLLTILVLVSSFLAPGCQLDPAPRADLVIVGGTLIKGTESGGAGNAVTENTIIIIRDGRIVAAGPQSHIPFPKGGETVDARGKWIVPGTFDEVEANLFPVVPISTRLEQGQIADLLILEDDPRIEGQTRPKIFKVIRAGKVIELGNLNKREQP